MEGAWWWHPAHLSRPFSMPSFGWDLDGHLFVETLLVIVIVFLLLQKSYKPKKRPLSEQEIDQLCEEWEPDSLHPPLTKAQADFKPPVLSSAAGPRTTVNGKEVVNLVSTNFLALTGHERVQEACTGALRKYGVGSCGPRGFYGTIDVHMDLEEKVAKWLGTEDTILYSYGLATSASTIPAFCKRGDLILADEGVHWGIQNGLTLSRSTVKYFKHNDMDDLERLLESVVAEDRKKRRVLNRRFIIAEGIYLSSGQLAPLKRLVELKDKYLFRLLLDESLSIGVLGATGRGATEHWGVPIGQVDIITAAMGNAFASVGGFCTGSSKVVDHQRLSGAGYCFSASLPPYLAVASMAALDELQEKPALLQKLRANTALMHRALGKVPGLKLEGDPESPVMHLRLRESSDLAGPDQESLQHICDKALEDGAVLVTVNKTTHLDRVKVSPSIRVTVTAGHEQGDLQKAASALGAAARAILKQDIPA